MRQARRVREREGDGRHVGRRRRPEVVPGGGKRNLPLKGLGQIMQDRNNGIVLASAKRVAAGLAGLQNGAVGQHLAHGPQGRLAEPRPDFLNSVARRDDRDGHESLLSVDPVSFTVTVSAKKAFLFHLLISPPLPCVPGTPPELPGTPRNSLPGTPLANVLSVTPWQGRPAFIEGTDRPLPLVYLLAGGETAAKLDRARR